MNETRSSYTIIQVIGIALVITALRILYLMINHRDLDVEESQYWTWSQHLSFGYHSKPPLISWVIHLSTGLFGHSEAAIRLFSPVAYAFTAFFIYQIGKTLFNEPIGFWSALTLLLLPGVAYSATIISTDPLLILFWTMALYYWIISLHTGKTSAWLLCGIAIGLGLISKYTMLLFFLSAGIYLIVSRPAWRNIFRSPGPYLAILMAGLIFTPNLIWNHTHHNIAINHVVGHNINIDGIHWHGKNLLTFLLSQVGILGPLLTVFFIIGICHHRQLLKDVHKLLLCFSLPIIFLMMGEALLSRAYGNWAAIAYPSALVFIVAFVYQHYRLLWLKLINSLHILVIVIFCSWEISIANGWSQWLTASASNWNDFGNLVVQQQQIYPQGEYLVDSRELWSKSIYYGKVPKSNLFVWDPCQKITWVDNPEHLQMPLGKDFILITHSAKLEKSMAQSFKNNRRLAEITVNQRLRGHHAKIYLYWLQNFSGYKG